MTTVDNAIPESLQASQSTLFDVLRHRHCRATLAYLEETADGETTLDDLAAQLATWETEMEGSERADIHSERIAQSLHHNHLPKLADTGTIDYDPRNKTVTYNGHDHLDAYLELLANTDSL